MTIVRPNDDSGWDEIRTVGDASVAITHSRARDGDGSLEFTQTGSDALADFGLFWSEPGRTLGRLSEIAFDWQRAEAGSAPANLAPALRLHYDADADPATPEDRGALIWEWKYNGEGAVPIGTWQEADLSDDHFWMFKHHPAKPVLEHEITLTGWATGAPGADPVYDPDPLSGASLITGIELASGNGWPGSFRGFVDNLKVAFGDDLIFANFEPLHPSPFTDGKDRIDLNDFDLAAHQDVSHAFEGDDVVRLSETQNLGTRFDAGGGDDRVHGSLSDDFLDGGEGSDRLIGRDGDDRIDGGGGNDQLRGGRGYDLLVGGAGDDELIGNQGHDVLDGGTGDDRLFGGGSEDVFLISGAEPGDDRILDFRSGMDVIQLEAVLDLEGEPIATFEDIDDDADGHLDPDDQAISLVDGELSWTYAGGSMTIEGIQQLVPEDVLVA